MRICAYPSKKGGGKVCDVRCCAECTAAEPIAGEPKTHHFPSYSRAGGRNQQKSMIFEQPQRRSVLHESREPYPCHTFRNDAADFFTPSCNFEATHAQRCNSCRSGACPNVQIHYPCRLRRRQEPCKNLAIITIRPRNGLVRVVNYCPCQPNAGATATPEKKQRNRAKRPHPPGPPHTSRIPRKYSPRRLRSLPQPLP